MSFRLSIPRITVLIATALANLEAREAAAAAQGPAQVPAPLNSPLRKLERAAAKVKAHFSEGHRKGIIAVLAEVFDVTDEERAKVLADASPEIALPWKVGDIIIPICDRGNGHNYPLDKPIINFIHDTFLKKEANELCQGNHMAPSATHWRFATREEIVKFGNDLTEAYERSEGGKEDALLSKMGLAPKE